MEGVELFLDPAGVEALVREQLATELRDRMQPVLEAAVAGAPRNTGQLAASLGLEVAIEGSGETTRATAAVGVLADADERNPGDATNQYVALISEFGNINDPPTHFLSQAYAASGL